MPRTDELEQQAPATIKNKNMSSAKTDTIAKHVTAPNCTHRFISLVDSIDDLSRSHHANVQRSPSFACRIIPANVCVVSARQ